MKNLLLVFSFLILIVFEVSAHVPYIEEELVRQRMPTLVSEDFSFEQPFVIEQAIEESQAVFALLRHGDVDFFKFTVTPEQIGFDPITGSPMPLVSASALPPACRAYRNAYPVTALMGPGLPPPNADLPFDVPHGLGVIVANNPRVSQGRKREVFNFPEGDYAWFLPQGLSEECLLTSPQSCDYSNTISMPVFVPGDYYIVIWDPKGRLMDYTANIGFREDLFLGPADTEEKIRSRARAEAIQPLVDGFKTNHRRCLRVY